MEVVRFAWIPAQGGAGFSESGDSAFQSDGFDEVAFGPLQLGWAREEILERVHADTGLDWRRAIERPRAVPALRRRQKRVAIASVIVLDPDVLLLDEPPSMLDPRSQSQVIELLENWNNGKKQSSRRPINWRFWARSPDGRWCWITGRWWPTQRRPRCWPTPGAGIGKPDPLPSAPAGGVPHKHPSPYLRRA